MWRPATKIVELESSKAVQPLISPVAGTVKYVNRDVADDPSVVNGDPYGEGWLLKVELDDDEPELLSADEYAKVVRYYPWLPLGELAMKRTEGSFHMLGTPLVAHGDSSPQRGEPRK